MLTIKPADDVALQAFKVEFPFPELQAQILRDGEAIIGEVVYTITPEEMRFLRFRSEDRTLYDFLLRGVLNIGWRRGVIKAVCNQADVREFLLAEGFSATDTGAEVEIAAFFARPCCGH